MSCDAVRDRLAPWLEGLLGPAEARQLGEHLAGCRACAGEAEGARGALARLRSFAEIRMPSTDVDAVRSRLSSLPAPVPARLCLGAPLAAALALAAAGAVVYLMVAPRLRVERTATPSPFEAVARRAHEDAAAGRLALELRSSSPAEIRRWVRQATGLSVNLVSARGPAGEVRFRPRGARRLQVGPARAALVRYEVDGVPTTLLTARAADVDGRPTAWSPLGKTVRLGRDPLAGLRTLTWTSGGQVYTLVTALPGHGERACGMCHDEDRRLRQIEALGTM